MKRLFLLIIHLSAINYFSNAQELLKEQIIQQSSKNSKFYSFASVNGPSVIDMGDRGFVVKSLDKIILCDNDLNKKWEVPIKEIPKTISGVTQGTSYFLANPSFIYDIIFYKPYVSKPIEISLVSYNLENGSTKNKSIIYQNSKEIEIKDCILLSDALYFLKLEKDSKTNTAIHYLVHIDFDAGKTTEKKLALPYAPEEMKSLNSTVHFEGESYNLFGIQNDRMFLKKGYLDSKTDQLKFSVGSIDKTGKYTVIANKFVAEPEKVRSLSMPSICMDSVNGIIYVAGYLIGSTGFTGIYFNSIDIKSGNTISDKIIRFDEFNAANKPKILLDNNIKFAETGMNGNFENYSIEISPDIYNKLAVVNLVKRKDAVLADGYAYMYLQPDGKVVETVKIIIPKQGIEKTVSFTDNSKKIHWTGLS